MVDSLCSSISGLVLSNSSGDDVSGAILLYRNLANADRSTLLECFDRVDIAQLAARVDSLLPASATSAPPTPASIRLVDTLRDIGRLLLSACPPAEVLAPRRQAEFLRALDTCASAAARVFCVNQLTQAAAKLGEGGAASVAAVAWDHALLRRLADLLGLDEDEAAAGGDFGAESGALALASAAGEFWLAAGTPGSGLDCRLLAGDLSNVFIDRVVGHSDSSGRRRPKDAVKRLRGLELAARLAARNPAALVAMETAGLLEALASDAEGRTGETDPLLMANCLDVLAVLAGCRHGLNWMLRSGLLSRLDRRLLSDADTEDIVTALLRPQLMQLFGQAVSASPDPSAGLADLPGFTGFLRGCLAQLPGSCPDADAFVAMATVGYIGGAGVAGKAALLARPELVAPLAAVLRRSPRTEPRVCALEALGRLLGAPDASGGDTAAASELSERLWTGPLGLRMAELERLARMPIEEIRVVALRVLEAVACQDWGAKQLAGQASLLEFLMSRQPDHGHEVASRKFAAIEAACRSPGFERHFDGATQLRLRLHMRQGVYHAPAAQATVATDGAG